jgi:two-component system, response regulator
MNTPMPINEVEVLLVEDSPEDRELALLSFQRNRLANNIQIARDGEEALDILFGRGEHANAPLSKPKVILLDIKLPKVDGLEVLRAIKADERTRMIPVVVMTSSAEQKDMVESYKLGVNSYVQKPVDFSKFQEVMKQLGFYWLAINKTPGPV